MNSKCGDAGGDIIEQIRCNCHDRAKIVAERDEQGNVYVLCRGCKEKIKIETDPKKLWPNAKTIHIETPLEPKKESREDERSINVLGNP